MTLYSNISVPEYTVDTEPDYVAIGSKINAELLRLFEGRTMVLRALGAGDHGLPVQALVERVMENGTDRVDSTVRGRGYHNVECDFFAARSRIEKGHTMSERFLQNSYQLPKAKGKDPMRIDVFLAYDPEQVEMVPYTRDGREMKDAFKFKNPERKKEALEAVIRIDS